MKRIYIIINCNRRQWSSPANPLALVKSYHRYLLWFVVGLFVLPPHGHGACSIVLNNVSTYLCLFMRSIKTYEITVCKYTHTICQQPTLFALTVSVEFGLVNMHSQTQITHFAFSLVETRVEFPRSPNTHMVARTFADHKYQAFWYSKVYRDVS